MQISNYSHVHSSYITEHPREKLKIKIIALNECRDAEISTYKKKNFGNIFEIQTIFEHLIKSLLVQKLKFSLMETFRIQYDKYYKSHQFISSHRPKKKKRKAFNYMIEY